MRAYAPILLLSALVAAGDVPRAGEEGWVPFTEHCYDHQLVDGKSMQGERTWLIEGTCDVNGEQKQYMINPGACVGNDQGRLKWWKAGNYFRSCKGCRLTVSRRELYLSCTCTDDPFGSSTINLSDGFAWHEDNVKCFM